MTPIIHVQQLCKVFYPSRKKHIWRPFSTSRKPSEDQSQAKVALHPVDFSVNKGEMIAFIGPNGAGKSTTIKMLTGILHPTSGDATVLNLRPWQQRVALSYNIGTVFGQKSQLWYHLPPKDTFSLMAEVYSLSKSDFVKRRNELVDRFRLGPLMDTPVRKLSLGERMRCEIALSFLHRPKILFLDEPTIGLDVVVKQNIRELILARNREEGVTVFLTSHDATDVESLCQRVLVINHGKLLFDGPTQQLVHRFLHFKEVVLHIPDGQFDIAWDGVRVQRGVDGLIRVLVDVSKVRVDQLLADVLQRYSVKDVSIREPSMEEVIRSIYTASMKSPESPEIVTI